MKDLVIQFNFYKSAEKFLAKNKNLISREDIKESLIKAVYRLNGYSVNIDLAYLKGALLGKYRIRKGDIRIIFEYFNNEIHVVNIEEIGFRGDIYKQ